MKKLLWTSAMALTAVACLTACDDSGSSSSSEIPTYKTESALPDSCEMEVAKAGDTYFACFENEWVEVTDSATVEKIKEGLDEKELKEQLEELEEKLEEAAAATKKSSSSKKVASSADADEGDVTPESSASEECTGRRCGNGNSSSSKKSSGGNGGSGSGDSGSGSGSGSSSDSGVGSSDSDEESSSSDKSSSSVKNSSSSVNNSSSSVNNSSSSKGSSSSSKGNSSSSVSSSSVAKCGDATYNPETEWCHTTDNTVIAFKNTNCCGTGTKACQVYAMNGNLGIEASSPNFYDITKAFCDTRGTGTIYKMVTIGTQTWMAENLNYATAEGSYCYSGLSSNCEKYGRLYTWDVAVDNACPTGWHLPTHDEILELFDEVGSAEPLHVSGTSGFDLLLAGKYTSSSFSSLNTWTCLWTATEATTSTSAHCPGFNSGSSLYPKETQAKTGAFSVRCLKD